MYPATWNLSDSSESLFKDFFENYYIILYQAVNTLFLHNVFRVCLHWGGGPRIGEVKCGGSTHLLCNCDQIEMRDYMDKRDTPPKRVNSPTWGSLPPCKQTLCHYNLVISVSMKFYYHEIRILWSSKKKYFGFYSCLLGPWQKKCMEETVKNNVLMNTISITPSSPIH